MLEIDAELVGRLVTAQFPGWLALPVRQVLPGGHDNRTFRLGDAFSVRLPSAERYVPQVRKEQRWLPFLRQYLSLPIPVLVAIGEPGEGYPWVWSVCRWIDGACLDTLPERDDAWLAAELAHFLHELAAVPAKGGPTAGEHNFHRGGRLAVYDPATRHAIRQSHAALGHTPSALARVWDRALASGWDKPPVWIHGDIAPGNLLVADGSLCAVIDFGCMGTGDPACDLAIAWTYFTGDSRRAFVAAMDMDIEVWQRARGWALWKSLITFAAFHATRPAKAAEARRVIGEILAEE